MKDEEPRMSSRGLFIQIDNREEATTTVVSLIGKYWTEIMDT